MSTVSRLTHRYYVADPTSQRRAEHPDGHMVSARFLFMVTTHGGTPIRSTRFGIVHHFTGRS